SAVPTEAAPVPTWPAAQVVSLYSDSYAFAPTSLNSYNEGWWDNPTLTEETISENKYLHYNGRMTGMIGWQFSDIAVTTMEYIHVDIWPSANTTLNMGPTSPHSPNNAVASVAIEVVAGKWNSIDIPVSALVAANPDFTLADVFQNQFTGYSALTDLSVDNVFFYRTTPYVDPTKPTDFTAALTGNSYFSVTIKANAKDDSGAVLYDVINGELVVATGSAASGADANIVVKDLAPNTEYNFKVVAKDATGNATDPITVAAKTLAAPAPAPAPTYAADKVFAIYTDAYTNHLSDIQPWYASPAIVEGQLTATSKTLCLEPNTTEESCLGFAFAPTDITGYDALEMDVYATVAGVLTIQVIGVGEVRTPYNLVANQWNHIVLSIAGNTKTDCEQIGVYNCDRLAGTCFIQNVLFVEYVPMITCAEVYSKAKNDAVNLNDVTVTYSSGANVWVKDATGAMLVYLPSGFTNTFKAGDVLSGVAGVVDIYQTIVYEVKPSAEQAAAIQATAGEAPAALEVTAIANSDVNKYVVLKGATITGEFTTASKTSLTATIGENTITVYNNFKKAFTFAEGKTYDITGVVSAYNGKAQVYFISAEEGTSTAINNAVVSEKAVKMIENGQLIIMKNGVKYNAQGAELR
ncbi:MAG: fibronectin type III domain-containing protein, partial [Paludibacteraceae bacterium]|nr:fibronectin type III domain-containing protein [Paludibacteraceae bacterium]